MSVARSYTVSVISLTLPSPHATLTAVIGAAFLLNLACAAALAERAAKVSGAGSTATTRPDAPRASAVKTAKRPTWPPTSTTVPPLGMVTWFVKDYFGGAWGGG
jgi:hypothetical protein